MRSLIALLASLLATLMLVGCTGSETVSLESVAQAATTTQKAGSSRMTMEMSVEVGGKRMKVTADGAIDYKRARGWMEMDLGALGALTEGSPAPRITLLFEGNTIWMRMPPELAPQAGGKPWLRTTVGGSGLNAGMQSPDPSQMLGALRGISNSVEKRGRKNVRGVATTHYRAQIDLDKAMAEAPARERGQAKAMLKLFGAADSMPTDFYLDDAGRVRRMRVEYEYEVFEQKMSAELNFDLFAFGTRVQFKRPPARQVADLSSLTQ
jgi:hypothetical protein